MKTIEELREREEQLIESKHTWEKHVRADTVELDGDKAMLADVEKQLAAVRAEIAAMTAFNPPNRITHSNQLREGMRVNVYLSHSKPNMSTVTQIYENRFYYRHDNTGYRGWLHFSSANIAVVGKPTILIEKGDCWVERVEEVCGVPGCPFREQKPISKRVYRSGELHPRQIVILHDGCCERKVEVVTFAHCRLYFRTSEWNMSDNVFIADYGIINEERPASKPKKTGNWVEIVKEATPKECPCPLARCPHA